MTLELFTAPMFLKINRKFWDVKLVSETVKKNRIYMTLNFFNAHENVN